MSLHFQSLLIKKSALNQFSFNYNLLITRTRPQFVLSLHVGV